MQYVGLQCYSLPMIQLKDVVIGDKLAVLNPGLEP